MKKIVIMNALKVIRGQFRLERIVQIYLGVFLLSNVSVGWLIPLSELKLPHASELFITQLWQINILMPTVKLIEFVTALMFLFNWNSFLGLLIFYPVLFNIICIGLHFFGSVQYSALMIAGILYLTWVRRACFKGLMMYPGQQSNGKRCMNYKNFDQRNLSSKKTFSNKRTDNRELVLSADER